MSAWVSCDHVAAQLGPPLGLTFRDVRDAERGFGFVRDLVETSAVDGQPAGLAVAEGVLEPSGRIALRGHRVELRQPPMVDGPRRFDELLCPRDGLVLYDPGTEECRVGGDGGGGVEIPVV